MPISINPAAPRLCCARFARATIARRLSCSASAATYPAIPLSTLRLANEFIWLIEDTPTFIAGRVEAAIERYRENLLPPMFAAMLAQANVHEYAFGTPGHLGGTAFLKTPVSKVFFDYFGENMLRSDLSVGMAAVGSLLDHSGPIGESEKYAARVFGAHRSYTVTNGHRAPTASSSWPA